MFGDIIDKSNQIYRRLEFCGSNIHADECVDNSFEVVLKLLLSGRTDEHVYVNYITDDNIDEITTPDLDYAENPKTDINIINLNDNDIKFEEIKDIDLGEDWTRLDKYCEYAGTIDKMNFFVNEENHKAVVVIAYATPARIHFVESLTSRIVPWFFAETPIKAVREEMAVVKALCDKGYAEFVTACNNLIALKQLDKEWLSRKITKLFVDTAETRFKNAEKEVEEIRDNIHEYEKMISEKYRQLTERVTYLHGARLNLDNAKDSSELNDYLKLNPQIKILDVDNGTIKFTTEKYLNNYPEGIEAMLDRSESTIYQEDDDFSDREKRTLFEGIFKDNTIRVKLRAELAFNIEDCSYSARRCEYEDQQLNTAYPNALNNPHLSVHSCFGGYRSDIGHALQSGNVINSLMICDACVGSLNIAEDATFRHFVKDILNTRRKVCEVDGQYMTPKEAVKYLEERK